MASGLLFAGLTPPFQSPDEPAHLYRAWQLSRGTIVPTGSVGDVPVSLVDSADRWLGYRDDRQARVTTAAVRADLRRPLRSEVTRPYPFANTAVYSPLPYGPAVIGVWIGRAAGVPAVGLLYLARLGGVIGYAAVGWLAVRTTPVLKWATAAMLLTPTAVFLAGSVSADPMTTAFTALATAAALRLAIVDRRATGWDVLGLAVVMVAVGLCKGAYALVVLLAFAVPWRRWPGRHGWAWPVVIAGLTAGVVVGWSAAARPLEVRMHGNAPHEQMAWVVGHPLEVFVTAVRTIGRERGGYYGGAIGVLGWTDVWVPEPVLLAYGGMVAWLVWVAGEPVRTPAAVRVAAGLAVAASVGLIFVGEYLLWTPIGRPLVEGVQGRYFLPLGLVAAVAVRRVGTGRVRPAWVSAGVAAGLAVGVYVLAGRYYLPAR